jgi:hypothetical protein
MTDQEAEAELVELRRLQGKAHDYVHELVAELQVFLSELDFAVMRARKALDEFYTRHPELK